MGKTLLSLPFKENFPRRSTSGSEFNTGTGSAAHKNVYKVYKKMFIKKNVYKNVYQTTP